LVYGDKVPKVADEESVLVMLELQHHQLINQSATSLLSDRETSALLMEYINANRGLQTTGNFDIDTSLNVQIYIIK